MNYSFIIIYIWYCSTFDLNNVTRKPYLLHFFFTAIYVLRYIHSTTVCNLASCYKKKNTVFLSASVIYLGIFRRVVLGEVLKVFHSHHSAVVLVAELEHGLELPYRGQRAPHGALTTMGQHHSSPHTHIHLTYPLATWVMVDSRLDGDRGKLFPQYLHISLCDDVFRHLSHY